MLTRNTYQKERADDVKQMRQIIIEMVEQRRVTPKCFSFLNKVCPNDIQRIFNKPGRDIFDTWEQIHKGEEILFNTLRTVNQQNQWASYHFCKLFTEVSNIQANFQPQLQIKIQPEKGFQKSLWLLRKELFRYKKIIFWINQYLDPYIQKEPEKQVKSLFTFQDNILLDKIKKLKSLNQFSIVSQQKRLNSIFNEYFKALDLKNYEQAKKLVRNNFSWDLSLKMQRIVNELQKQQSPVSRQIQNVIKNNYLPKKYSLCIIKQIQQNKLQYLYPQEKKEVLYLWQNFKQNFFLQKCIYQLAQQKINCQQITQLFTLVDKYCNHTVIKQGLKLVFQKCKDEYYLKQLFRLGSIIKGAENIEQISKHLSNDWKTLWLINSANVKQVYESLQKLIKQMRYFIVSKSITNEKNQLFYSNQFSELLKHIFTFTERLMQKQKNMQKQSAKNDQRLNLQHLSQEKQLARPIHPLNYNSYKNNQSQDVKRGYGSPIHKTSPKITPLLPENRLQQKYFTSREIQTLANNIVFKENQTQTNDNQVQKKQTLQDKISLLKIQTRTIDLKIQQILKRNQQNIHQINNNANKSIKINNLSRDEKNLFQQNVKQLEKLRKQIQTLKEIIKINQYTFQKIFPLKYNQNAFFQLSAYRKHAYSLKQKINNINFNPVQFNFYSMFTGEIFQREQAIQKRQIIEAFQNVTHKKVKWTKLLFRPDQKKKVNFHESIDNKSNLCLLLSTLNNRYILAFTSGCLTRNEQNAAFSIILSLSKDKMSVFHMKKGSNVLATKYDDSFFRFGNSDLRIRPNQGILFSNIQLSSSSFELGNLTVDDLLGMGDQKEVQIRLLQFHQIGFYQ